MSGAELRRATPADAAAIRELTRAAYAKWAPLIGREPKPMTADYDEAVGKHRFDLLELEGVLVGLIETIEEPGQLLIENVAIAPDFQRRGLGRALMAHAEKVALASGYQRIRLYTNRRFAGNVALYLKLGYAIDAETEIPGGVLVDMSKSLRSDP